MIKTTPRATLLRQRAAALEEQARIDRELAALEEHGDTAPTEYGSRAPYSPPPRRSHRWLRENAKLVGADRHGGVRGRDVVYLISAERYAAWLASQSNVVVAPVLETEDERFDRLASTSGLRRTA